MLLMEAEQRTRLGRGTRGVSVWGHCVAVASRKVDEGERGHRDDALASRLAPCGSEGCCQSGGERRSFRMRTRGPLRQASRRRPLKVVKTLGQVSPALDPRVSVCKWPRICVTVSIERDTRREDLTKHTGR